MSLIKFFLKQLDDEAKTTRKMLSIVPDDKYDWQPHPKSMTIRRLATHVAELPSWITMTLTTSELDFASNPYTPEVINNTAALLKYFEKNLADGRRTLRLQQKNSLHESWTLRNGKDIYSTSPKSEVLRMAYQPDHSSQGTVGCISSSIGCSHTRQLWAKCGRYEFLISSLIKRRLDNESSFYLPNINPNKSPAACCGSNFSISLHVNKYRGQ